MSPEVLLQQLTKLVADLNDATPQTYVGVQANEGDDIQKLCADARARTGNPDAVCIVTLALDPDPLPESNYAVPATTPTPAPTPELDAQPELLADIMRAARARHLRVTHLGARIVLRTVSGEERYSGSIEEVHDALRAPVLPINGVDRLNERLHAAGNGWSVRADLCEFDRFTLFKGQDAPIPFYTGSLDEIAAFIERKILNTSQILQL